MNVIAFNEGFTQCQFDLFTLRHHYLSLAEPKYEEWIMTPWLFLCNICCQPACVDESFVWPTIGLAKGKEKGNLPFVPYVCAVPLSPCFRLAPCSRNSYLSVWEWHSQEDAFQRRIGGSPDSDSFMVAQRKCLTRRMLEQETVVFCFIWDLKQGSWVWERKLLSNLDWGFSITRDYKPQ